MYLPLCDERRRIGLYMCDNCYYKTYIFFIDFVTCRESCMKGQATSAMVGITKHK